MHVQFFITFKKNKQRKQHNSLLKLGKKLRRESSKRNEYTISPRVKNKRNHHHMNIFVYLYINVWHICHSNSKDDISSFSVSSVSKRCRLSQYAAVCVSLCSALMMYCSLMQCAAVYCSVLHFAAVPQCVWQCIAAFYSVLQRVAGCCSVLCYAAVCCSAL